MKLVRGDDGREYYQFEGRVWLADAPADSAVLMIRSSDDFVQPWPVPPVHLTEEVFIGELVNDVVAQCGPQRVIDTLIDLAVEGEP